MAVKLQRGHPSSSSPPLQQAVSSRNAKTRGGKRERARVYEPVIQTTGSRQIAENSPGPPQDFRKPRRSSDKGPSLPEASRLLRRKTIQAAAAAAAGTVPPAGYPSYTVTLVKPRPASRLHLQTRIPPAGTHKSPPSLLKAQAKATTWSVARLMTGTQSMACSSQPNMLCSCCTSSCKRGGGAAATGGKSAWRRRKGLRPPPSPTLQKEGLKGSCSVGSAVTRGWWSPHH